MHPILYHIMKLKRKKKNKNLFTFFQKSTSLIISLRAQLKDMKNEIKYKKIENDQIKKNIKYSKIRELEVKTKKPKTS